MEKRTYRVFRITRKEFLLNIEKSKHMGGNSNYDTWEKNKGDVTYLYFCEYSSDSFFKYIIKDVK